MQTQCAAIIAGGASRRMGSSKALLSIDGRPLIAHVAALLREVFPRLVVITGDATTAAAANAPATPDIYSGKGPLAGVHAALSYWGAPTFCVACDMPYVNASFIRYQCAQLADYDAVVPRIGGYAEPLYALYAPSCLPVMEAALRQERVGPFSTIYDQLQVRYIDEPEARPFDAQLRMFENWNTPEQVKTSLTGE